jgi:hypothetical protein
MSKFLILSTKLRLGNSADEYLSTTFPTITDKFRLKDNDVEYLFPLESVAYEEILKDLEDVQKFLKSKKNKMIGELYAILLQSDGNRTGKIKLYAQRKLSFEPCKFRITVVKDKSEVDEKEKISEEEKVELFKKFVAENKREPETKDIIEGFRVGQFYMKFKKNDEYFQVLKSVLEEII